MSLTQVPAMTPAGRGGPNQWLGRAEATRPEPLGDDRWPTEERRWGGPHGGAPGSAMSRGGRPTGKDAGARRPVEPDPWLAGADPWAASAADPWAAGADPWAGKGPRAKAAEKQPTARAVTVEQLSAFLHQRVKPGQLEQWKRKLLDFAWRGETIGGLLLDVHVIEEAIQEVEGKTVDVADDNAAWWTSRDWESHSVPEDRAGNTAWQPWKDNDKWWESHDDRWQEDKDYTGETHPEVEDEQAVDASGVHPEDGAELMRKRLVEWLHQQSDVEKSMAIIRASAKIPPRIAEEAIARFAASHLDARFQ